VVSRGLCLSLWIMAYRLLLMLDKMIGKILIIGKERNMPPRFAPNAPKDGRFSRCQNDGPQNDLRELAERLEQAVMTLRALPHDAGSGPAGVRSAWPEMIRRSRFVVEETRLPTPARPSPASIQDLDRIAILMWTLTSRHRQLVWARACKVRWAELCLRQRRSRTTLFRDYRLALAALAQAEAEDSS
jgi:hypothetical protein